MFFKKHLTIYSLSPRSVDHLLYIVYMYYIHVYTICQFFYVKRAKKYPGEKSPGVVSSYHQSVQPLVNAVFLQQLIPECRIIQSTLRICNTLIFQKMSC